MLRALSLLPGAWARPFGQAAGVVGRLMPASQQAFPSAERQEHRQALEERRGSADACSTSGLAGQAVRWFRSSCGLGAEQGLEYAVTLGNLRDNSGARKKRIRLGRGNSSRRGNTSGRGNKGLKARDRAHILYDGGQLGLIKFPIMRERPSYEVLYNHMSINRLLEFIQLGWLDHRKLITMKDLRDSGCITDSIEHGVYLYGKGPGPIGFPLHIQVSGCEDSARAAIEASGGSVTRVYYTKEGLRALLEPERYVQNGIPYPKPPPGWHPKHDGKFDSVGQLPPSMTIVKPLPIPRITETQDTDKETMQATQ